MLQNKFSMRQFRRTKWSYLVPSTTHNAPYIQPSHDSIFELWRTFPNGLWCDISFVAIYSVGVAYETDVN